MKYNSENEILSGLKKGDRKALEVIYKAQYNRLFAYAFKIIDNGVDAHDIVNDSFLKLWDKRMEISENLYAYLFRIVRSIAWDYLKNKKVNGTEYSVGLNVELESYIQVFETANDPLERLIYLDMENQIEFCIEELPEPCKSIFILSRKKGLKNREIAAHLQISIQTVERRISEALRILRYKILLLFLLLFF